MKIEITKSEDNEITFNLEDANPAVANAIRRTIISEVPALAIEDIEIMENTSFVYDEIIAHRLGLVPIKTDLEIFNFREECKCEGKGCSKCTLKLYLEKEGPCTVYSHDLKSEDAKLKPAPGIPLLKLADGQKIKLEADAILGRGRNHAKWQPASVAYKYYPEIEISEKCDACGDCVEACPRNILELAKDRVKVKNKTECILCNSCVEACELEAISVRGNDKKFIFKLGTTSSLKPKEVLKKSLEILEHKSKELASLL